MEYTRDEGVSKNSKLEEEKLKEQKLMNKILQLKKRKLQAELSKIETANNIQTYSFSSSESISRSLSGFS